MGTKKGFIFISLFAGLLMVPGLLRAEGVETDPPPAPVESVAEHGLGHKLLFYVPNRLLDVFDIMRARLRVGPGWSLGFRATERLAFSGANYRTVYMGLPGPRAPQKWKSPVGFEKMKGLVFVGVDATDVSSHPPGYSLTEIEANVQLLAVGADLGLDFWEIADFFTGLVLIDLRKDDL